MAKFEVTPELAATLKSLRIQNNVTAKSIAELIGKSASYISKLEKAEIKTIKESELTTIFNFIYCDVENGREITDSILKKIYNTIELRYTEEEIDRQSWWTTYDTVLRLIPVPADLIDDIVARMKAIGLTSNTLCERINANEGISPQVTNIDRYPFNEWKAFVKNHKPDFYFIKMKVDVNIINRILSKEVEDSNYVTMLAISYYLRKIERFGTEIVIPEEENKNLNIEARDYLNKFKFFSIEEKYKINKLAKSEEERESLISTFDQENRQLVNKILVDFKIFSDLDIRYSNKIFSILIANLKWDLPFMMAMSGVEFCELENISHSNKKNMLNEIRSIVKKYKEMPEEQRKLDSYD